MSELGPGSATWPGSGDGKTSWPWESESARTNLPGPTLIQVAAAAAGSAPGLAGGLRARLRARLGFTAPGPDPSVSEAEASAGLLAVWTTASLGSGSGLERPEASLP